jgi:hypothetical protein
MFRTFPILLAVGCLATGARAATTEYLGLYLKGQKVGYASYATAPDLYRGRKVTRTTSYTLLSMKLLDQPTKIVISGSTLADGTGHPLRMYFDQESSGRRQQVTAEFGTTKANVTVDNSGTISHRSLDIPTGGVIEDDPLEGVVFSHVKPGQQRDIYVLDPTTVSFIKNTLVFKGLTAVDVRGKLLKTQWVEILDPRSNTQVYCSQAGAIIKISAPLGVEMYPESRKFAMAGIGNSNVDLAVGNKLTPEGGLPNPAGLHRLQLTLTTSTDLGSVPTDSFQTVEHSGDSWLVDVHPTSSRATAGVTIAQAATTQPDWTKPDLNVPSDEVRFRNLAKKIIGSETDVLKASYKIQDYVCSVMRPDASIAVLRDANEVLSTKRGVCRDYAILCATLLRAAGIPTQLATGLVSWDGDFYYHAWVKVYDGSNWIGIDSTTMTPQMSASHIELAVGTVGQVFSAPVLQSAKIKVVSATE